MVRANPKISLTQAEHAIVSEILTRQLPLSCEVLVFGSRFNGSPKRFSDLDLCLKDAAAVDVRLIGNLREAFDNSALPFKVDLVDYWRVSGEFRQVIDQTASKFS